MTDYVAGESPTSTPEPTARATTAAQMTQGSTGAVATAAVLTVVVLPVGLMVFNRLPAVMTLQRN
jgi:hypothetical protein